MGFSISWLACRGLPYEEVIACLSLGPTGHHDEFARAAISAKRFSDGWTLVVTNRCDHAIVHSTVLAELSSASEVVACNIEEHVMYSSAEFWCNGRRVWRVEHASEEGEEHLASEGTLPGDLARQITEAKSRQAMDDEVDEFFDIPLNLAKTVVDFKHDEAHPLLELDDFEVLESLAPTRPWWAFWK